MLYTVILMNFFSLNIYTYLKVFRIKISLSNFISKESI